MFVQFFELYRNGNKVVLAVSKGCGRELNMSFKQMRDLDTPS